MRYRNSGRRNPRGRGYGDIDHDGARVPPYAACAGMTARGFGASTSVWLAVRQRKPFLTLAQEIEQRQILHAEKTLLGGFQRLQLDREPADGFGEVGVADIGQRTAQNLVVG
jgi:hypothetical protein